MKSVTMSRYAGSPMVCVDENILSDFLQDRLSVDAEAAVEKHIDGCDDCRMLLSELGRSFLAPPGPGESHEGDLTLPPLIDVGGRIGRYVILEWLGSGSMGVVYGAYDPQLDRKVALKLWRADALSAGEATELHARLTAEARAMAKMSHPNVVPIYETGSVDGHVFLAMEFVDGSTLLEWQADGERSWRDILDVYIRAGRGLEAAHAVDIVHRDFKPENVLIGRDGRPRVSDFGLARHARAAPSDVAGTPAYMAPEQASGIATHQSDQFSFCTALHEALSAGDRAVPHWVLAAVQRGLAEEPRERYPSMGALLARLTVDPGEARRRTYIRVGTSFAFASLLVLLFLVIRNSRHARDPICEGAQKHLDGIWDSAVKERIRQGIAGLGLSYGEAAWTRTARALDAYTERWVQASTDACEATHIRHEQSAELLALRTACLDERLREVKSVSDALAHAEERTLEKAPNILHTLGRLEACSDRKLLRMRSAQPSDARARELVSKAENELVTSRLLHEEGRYDAALEKTKEAVQGAREAAYPALEADARLRMALIEVDLNRPDAAVESLYEAIQIGEREHADRTVAKAWAELVGVVGYTQGRHAEAERIAKLADAAIVRLGEDDEVRARLEDRLASMAYRRGKSLDARAHTQKMVELYSKILDPSDTRIAEGNDYLAVIEAKLLHLEEAMACSDRAFAIWEKAVGDTHPTVAFAWQSRALVLGSMKRHQEAGRAFEHALAIWEKGHPPLPRLIAAAERGLAMTLDDLGNSAQAQPHIEKSLALDEQTFGPNHTTVATDLTHRARVWRHLGRYEQAIADGERALAIWRPKGAPAHAGSRYALLELGETRLASGKPRQAIEPLEDALKSGGFSDEQGIERAGVQFALARALWDSHTDRPRARALALASKDAFSKSAVHQPEVMQVSKWLTESEM